LVDAAIDAATSEQRGHVSPLLGITL